MNSAGRGIDVRSASMMAPPLSGSGLSGYDDLMTGEHAVQFGQKLQEAIEAKTKTVRARRDVISANEGDRYAIIVSRGLIGLYRDRPSTNRLVALRYAGEVVQPHEAGLRVHALVERSALG